ncbi:dipeptide ABC transporter ATP-binding protein [Paracoccus aestuariivivens]|uniref:Dipeptide ABC transporter ATP-binding protein n=1 Tax=Paracoccus aestuariivivens TaxID=1820333 RepID=A0A6L6J723_9RHOB|nr:ABC transporter ATP-binding protein [Paracoccus aestuariivivens]MTH77903.1 dipeptide ABC transporter ATP-binding protein [Paracoccus aestuariivivens]
MDSLQNQPHDLLRVEGLKVAFPLLRGELTAVDGASLRVLPGKITALVGESGSGKSMTGQTIMGLQPVQAMVSGRVLFDIGKAEPLDLLGLPRDGRMIRAIRGDRIGMIFQEPMTSFSPLHTIGNQLSEALRLHRPMSRSEARERCETMLARVGFPHPGRVFDLYPFELSGGMRQRAMIAMAAICGPSLLIADEPTTALDVTIQAQILALIRDLQQERGLAVLLITHDLGVVANLADEIVVMHRGQVMEAGPTAEIFRNPQHPYLRGLMQAVPVLGAKGRVRLRPLREIPAQGILELARMSQQPVAMRAPGARPLVSLRDVTKAFLPRHQSWSLISSNAEPVTAVDGVSLDIFRGECLGLVGESGSGKTTVGKLLVRALQPDSGSIIFDDGHDVVDIGEAEGKALDALRTRIQLIFQDPVSSLSPRMTVGNILSEPLDVHRRGTPAHRRQLVMALLRAIGLSEGAASRFPHSFSGGQRQRIGIARALALAPEFIICDEVVSALDVSVQAQILNLLKDLQKELHLTYMFISHDLGVVNYMADRIAVMWRGKLVEIGPRDLIMEAPVHPYTRALLAAVPVPDPSRPLDIAAARTPTAKAEAHWPAAFREVRGQPVRMADLGGGHLVRMQVLAEPHDLPSRRVVG